AELFWELLCVGQIGGSTDHPLLQKTRLGWVLAGRFGAASSPLWVHSNHAIVTNRQLHDQVDRLWQLDENFAASSTYSPEERFCEKHFVDNVSQNSQGRYIVKLPIKEHLLSKLGDSQEIALKRLRSLEKRFSRNPSLKSQYSHFMEEYLALGHMQRVTMPSGKGAPTFYLPHHCVVKPTGGFSKLRVVFDASCKSDSGISLNDFLGVGPVVQQDLASILIRFRYFRYVITTDIVKMYRQVLVDPAQTSLQKILWRNNPEDEVGTYELLTITYGTSAASFLATRCLIHLAEQHSAEFPLGSPCVKRDFYVDDLLTGADSIRELEQIRDEVIRLLRAGSFELSKWASNCPQLLESLRKHNGELVSLNSDDSSVLGIRWSQSQDMLLFSCELEPTCNVVSKRVILSEISRCFDPLGLLGPTIVIAKLILQELWQSGVHWDESVPQNLHARWLKLRAQLFDLNQIRIPRGVRLNSDLHFIQLHGFCDASQSAYGACIYVRTESSSGEYHSELLCSKSRVAPIKATSLPRLELSAALLLARLIASVQASLDVSYIQIFLWSDSTISLNWIASPSRRWSVFVANRVGEIQRLTKIEEWRHVSSPDNPADILSRGLDPHNLSNSALWWHGPPFLRLRDDLWPSGAFAKLNEDIPEQRKAVVATAAEVKHSVINDLLNKFSKLNKTCRIVAYCLRFSKAHRARASGKFISPDEFSRSLKVICRDVQKQAFPHEQESLSKGKPISSASRLLPLTPFIDKDGLIKVGGRLRNSQVDYNACHPILLPGDHRLTRLIIEREHVLNLHAGVQATMAAIRQSFWPLSLRLNARGIIRKCITCFKVNPQQSEAIMTSAPASRVTAARPFERCGIDYAGPVILREGKRRNAKNHKAYLAVFVCFVTKAVHIELVSDLTADAFLGAFRRFISRRGKPAHVFSDNRTNFVGANRQLKELYKFYNQSQTQDQIVQFLSELEISWNFIPPNAPHFGGLWEAAVKSAKLHMARIVGRAHLTFEELQTVLCEIEAILNSRPITALSSDPNDMSPLTPGHFLIGAALNSFPSRNLVDVPENRLLRWQRVEQIRQHFWRRWSTEYLQSLQERNKWKINKGIQLLPNQLVLVRQPNLAPLQWLLGRVQETHPGADGVARTATLQTSKGSITRPLTKLAILPLET
ncbi:PREDICTED: uncharacterized protein LOC108767463, partial [Trachymyrmex cornetzi]|uniref:uncharacterized protein LOC108767463 n=1 Tax=Trachymyrmex cornetzi TaxID=471704 RepID=UPI00084EF104